MIDLHNFYFQSTSSDRNNLQRYLLHWIGVVKILKCFVRTLKDGYESDSTLSYRRHQYTPNQSANKSLYTQVQKGGEVPHKGLGMQAPEKKGRKLILHISPIPGQNACGG